ncbi:peptide ABC transporter substrate-binding protein [Candidatus Epulonipiscium fishelsonii]|uniref:Peptide ABC transporter substrate-binding protein n=1 Tax=Candidatus Epulonipiscium fishelsonii TaxID=77094 RepID=A0ACC8XAX3_9FIRM|nr:peptide ABC transporter substrate-binding protein [Epulopiscium sp. SCG-B05WGA-EpuloA1]ONI39459.1 peptide ABC transporter substrate-binding protein [Epulopiscium sp. SCG-B11WGA-EpuloA1]
MDKKLLFEVKDIKKYFLIKKAKKEEDKVYVKAVDGLSFEIYEGETLGVIGESGCGKSTLGRNMLRLEEPTSGSIIFKGRDIVGLDKRQMLELRKEMQFIFQDPHSSMNPKLTIKDIISEPLDNFRKDMTNEQKTNYIIELLEIVGLTKDVLNRYPHEFSGGQKQRIVIARGIALNPSFVVCDESVSALDVSVQAQVINLLKNLQKKFSLTYMFISHDLRVIKHISDRIMVLYLGNIMEIAESNELFKNPKHPYTKSLINLVSSGEKVKINDKQILKGEIPSPLQISAGCPFNTRCPQAQDKCFKEKPLLEDLNETHKVACFFAN